MSRLTGNRLTLGAALTFTMGGALLLGGCSNRDAELSEKIAAVNAAISRAEAAAARAESAAKAAEVTAPAQPAEAEAEVDPEDDGTGDDPAAQNPNSGAFDNSVG